ncbi:MAG: hypothetical protein ABSA16_02520 [Thermoguttaceae bacterium]|jgi:hypothetical protein
MERSNLFLVVALIILFSAGCGRKEVLKENASSNSPGNEGKSRPVVSEPSAWQTDVHAFRNSIQKILDKIHKPTDTSDTNQSENEAIDMFDQYMGKDVTWTITFEGIGDKEEIKFTESLKNFIFFSMRADPKSIHQWKSFTNGMEMRCRARINSLMLSTRWDSGGHFAGWMPIVAINDAQPIK